MYKSSMKLTVTNLDDVGHQTSVLKEKSMYMGKERRRSVKVAWSQYMTN